MTPTIARMGTFLGRSAVEEYDGDATDREMVAALVADQETLLSTLSALCEVSEKHGDWATNDVATIRVQNHDKLAWMAPRAPARPTRGRLSG